MLEIIRLDFSHGEVYSVAAQYIMHSYLLCVHSLYPYSTSSMTKIPEDCLELMILIINFLSFDQMAKSSLRYFILVLICKVQEINRMLYMSMTYSTYKRNLYDVT